MVMCAGSYEICRLLLERGSKIERYNNAGYYDSAV